MFQRVEVYHVSLLFPGHAAVEASKGFDRKSVTLNAYIYLVVCISHLRTAGGVGVEKLD